MASGAEGGCRGGTGMQIKILAVFPFLIFHGGSQPESYHRILSFSRIETFIESYCQIIVLHA